MGHTLGGAAVLLPEGAGLAGGGQGAHAVGVAATICSSNLDRNPVDRTRGTVAGEAEPSLKTGAIPNELSSSCYDGDAGGLLFRSKPTP